MKTKNSYENYFLYNLSIWRFCKKSVCSIQTRRGSCWMRTTVICETLKGAATLRASNKLIEFHTWARFPSTPCVEVHFQLEEFYLITDHRNTNVHKRRNCFDTLKWKKCFNHWLQTVLWIRKYHSQKIVINFRILHSTFWYNHWPKKILFA